MTLREKQAPPDTIKVKKSGKIKTAQTEAAVGPQEDSIASGALLLSSLDAPTPRQNHNTADTSARIQSSATAAAAPTASRPHLFGRNTGVMDVGPRPLLFQEPLLGFHQNHQMTPTEHIYLHQFNPYRQVQNNVMPGAASAFPPRALHGEPSPTYRFDNMVIQSHPPGRLLQQPVINPLERRNLSSGLTNHYQFQNESMSHGPPATDAPSAYNNGNSMASDSDKEDAALALAALAVAGRPRFTEQDEESEHASMTDEERVEALCDVFGKECAIAGTHPSKRARKDLDRESIHFLVGQMRMEVECIPVNEKRALMEAQQKARPEEFSDSRLERFLRCTGMNPKVSYK